MPAAQTEENKHMKHFQLFSEKSDLIRYLLTAH